MLQGTNGLPIVDIDRLCKHCQNQNRGLSAHDVANSKEFLSCKNITRLCSLILILRARLV